MPDITVHMETFNLPLNNWSKEENKTAADARVCAKADGEREEEELGRVVTVKE